MTEMNVGGTNDYVLGLDIGTASVGWALVRPPGGKQDEGEPPIIAGVRVFPEGVDDEKGKVKSKSLDRRTARGMRRRTERRARRSRRLLSELREAGLLGREDTIPAVFRLIDGNTLDPYALRSRGLDEALTKVEFACALYHLSRRRGFKSNRYTDSENKEKGKVATEISSLGEAMKAAGCRTVGEYLFKHVAERHERRRGRYLDRGMTAAEFELLWKRQAPEHGLTEAQRERIHQAIFFQRPFYDAEKMRGKIGQCSFEPEEKRERRGHRLAHRFRILQEVDNLRIVHPIDGERPLTSSQRAEVVAYLHEHKTAKLTRLGTLLDLSPQVETLNLARAKRDSLSGNTSELTMRDAFGKEVWASKTEKGKNEICHDLLEGSDDDIRRWGGEKWGLPDDRIDYLLANPLKPDSHGHVSLKALENLLAQMEDGKSLTEAKEACGYAEWKQVTLNLSALPMPPGTRMQEWEEEKDPTKREKKRKEKERLLAEGILLPNTQEINNPVVRKALFQVRKVVNALVKEYGKPRAIVVELARDAARGIEERNEMTSDNRKRERERQDASTALKEAGYEGEPRGGDILKYLLWKEQGGQSVYSGRPIQVGQLLTGEVHVDHILPYRRSLDDSKSNKTLCFHDENADKGDCTPYEWLAGNADRYAEVKQRAARLPEGKKRKFFLQNLDLETRVERQLNDTKYICRVVRGYLQCLGIPVNVARGDSTAVLRRRWGNLNGILSLSARDKNRGDHRHHAVDAIVVALTNAKHLHDLAAWKRVNGGPKYPLPWPSFAEDVKSVIEGIVVSLAPTRRVRGRLHEETNYGRPRKRRHEQRVEPNRFLIRKRLADLTPNELSGIFDPGVRAAVFAHLRKRGLEPGEATPEQLKANRPFEDPHDPVLLPNRHGDPVPVRRVRIAKTSNKTFELGRNGSTRIVEPGENHHIAIFEWEEKGKLVRDVIGVTLFEAAQRLERREPIIQKQHPGRPDAEFVLSLCKNDIVSYKEAGSEAMVCRVQKFSIKEGEKRNGLDISFRPTSVSGVQDDSTVIRKRNLNPAEWHMEKLSVGPLGELYPAHD